MIIPTAWRLLLDGTGARQGDPLVVEAAYAEPRLRDFYPFPTHGTLRLLHEAPPRFGADDIPFIVCFGPPYQVYAPGYESLLAETATAQEAVAALLTHLPPYRTAHPPTITVP
ncbi:DUF6193 family natural product biosynthesis protein [Kitasatospora sp. NPDC058162]|uniref:DUF6193 family natural product biosynthesis protein n=1 Tax=Kitasatospora sp. NPDC058162 TaxID=3346362 RepID=UPI0036DA8C1B